MEFDFFQTENYIPKSLRKAILAHIQEPNLSKAREILEQPYVPSSSRLCILDMLSHLPLSPKHEFLRKAEKFITPGTVIDFTREGIIFKCENGSEEKELESLAQKCGLKLRAPR